jgi:uncharacterized membrane protein
MTTKAYEPLTPVEKIEQDASIAEEVAGGALRAVEIGAIVMLGLLICPPLAILAVLVIVPTAVAALVLGLIAAVLYTPFFLVHRFRGTGDRHAALISQRLRHAGHALRDLLPHRIVADARKPA